MISADQFQAAVASFKKSEKGKIQKCGMTIVMITTCQVIAHSQINYKSNFQTSVETRLRSPFVYRKVVLVVCDASL